MKAILLIAVLVFVSSSAFAQDEIPFRSQSNIILQIFQVDQTLAQAGSVHTAVVYDSDQDGAEEMTDILDGRGLDVHTLSISEFEDEAPNFSVVYYTSETEPDSDLTAEHEILSIGTNEQHFNDGVLSISFNLDDDQQVMIQVNRDQLDNENHQMEEGFFDLDRVVATN